MAEEEMMQVLKEIARWTRLAALPAAREHVGRVLDTDPKKRVYEVLATGTMAVRDIERATGVNHSDIGQWVKAWEGAGIVEPGSKPPKAVFTLQELGIDPPPAPVRKPRQGSA